MEALRRMIMEKGRGIGNDIVKVDMFLNHRIDTGLLFRMGEAWAEEFRDDHPDMVLTVEASGIAMAVAAAHALGDIPVVFAKKSATVVQDDNTVLGTNHYQHHPYIDRVEYQFTATDFAPQRIFEPEFEASFQLNWYHAQDNLWLAPSAVCVREPVHSLLLYE